MQTAKRLLEKAKTDGKDPYLGLLEYRNTPTDIGSPAQRLMSRELRSILPVTKKQLRPKTNLDQKPLTEQRRTRKGHEVNIDNSTTTTVLPKARKKFLMDTKLDSN